MRSCWILDRPCAQLLKRIPLRNWSAPKMVFISILEANWPSPERCLGNLWNVNGSDLVLTMGKNKRYLVEIDGSPFFGSLVA